MKQLILFIILSIVLFTVLMATKIMPYFRFEYAMDFLSTKTDTVLQNPIFNTAFYVHIISSWFVMIFGLVQFFPKILKKSTILHKNIGKIYIILILFFAAPSGLGMSFYANGGLSVKVAFASQSLVWWLFTYLAYQKIRQRQFMAHIDFMLKSYAVTLAAMTLRLGSYTMVHYFNTKPIETYLTVAWFSWIFNLFIAEILISMGVSRYLYLQFTQK